VVLVLQLLQALRSGLFIPTNICLQPWNVVALSRFRKFRQRAKWRLCSLAA
jgi:hypothetical protein